ncbi:hypothetical protein BC832DRAFT_591056 [Gaertneriomyces semiglobifer]|nr:hypothetical protein BC832DRAFT_591056 [Gaertneriomyces semiglobifer]
MRLIFLDSVKTAGFQSPGLTEIRGPYYSIMGKRYLQDVMETAGAYVDSLKFAGGSFTLMPTRSLRELTDVAHSYDVQVSTGGFIERILVAGAGRQRIDLVDKYLTTCKEVGFDTVELSAGFITLPSDDWARLVDRVHAIGLKAKPEVGIQFGAGGDTATSQLESEGTKDVESMIAQVERFITMGCEIIMIESEGITENVPAPRFNVASRLINAVGTEHIMFEAADPRVFTEYIKTYGPNVNLFVDHSQALQLEALRQGIWGTMDVWGRVVSYRPKHG